MTAAVERTLDKIRGHDTSLLLALAVAPATGPDVRRLTRKVLAERGCIKVAIARSTGTRVEVWRSIDFGDEQDAPWITVCEHGSICEHATRETALAFSTEPESWCQNGCDEAAKGRLAEVGA